MSGAILPIAATQARRILAWLVSSWNMKVVEGEPMIGAAIQMALQDAAYAADMHRMMAKE